MASGDTKLHVRRGDTNKLRVEAVDTDADGNEIPYDITGTTMWFTAKYSVYDDDIAAVIRKTNSPVNGISYVDPIGGIAEVVLDPEDTENLDGNQFVFDVQIVDSSSGEVNTIVFGDLIIDEQVTRAR